MLIDEKNRNVGRIDTRRAIEMAEAAGLDLVEVAPSARPPVAKILDYSKFVYEKKRREREARKIQNQKKVQLKTIRLKLKTSDFHRSIQTKKARKWLTTNKKVKTEIRFYGREITYPELGRKTMSEVKADLEGLFVMEQEPRMEGRKMIMMMAPSDEALAIWAKRQAEAEAKGESLDDDDDDEVEEDDQDVDGDESAEKSNDSDKQECD